MGNWGGQSAARATPQCTSVRPRASQHHAAAQTHPRCSATPATIQKHLGGSSSSSSSCRVESPRAAHRAAWLGPATCASGKQMVHGHMADMEGCEHLRVLADLDRGRSPAAKIQRLPNTDLNYAPWRVRVLQSAASCSKRWSRRRDQLLRHVAIGTLRHGSSGNQAGLLGPNWKAARRRELQPAQPCTSLRCELSWRFCARWCFRCQRRFRRCFRRRSWGGMSGDELPQRRAELG